MIGVGIVGYGYAGRVFHAPLIAQTEGLRLVAVSSRDAERRAQASQQWDVTTYATPEELFGDPEVELVVIATPHDTHFVLGQMALQAGKHVVIDKPFTLSSREADTLIAEARQRGRMLSVFHNRRWDSDFLSIQRIIQQGQIGEVWWVESCVGRYGHSRRWRTLRQSMGSLLHDWGAHLIDQALQLMGMPQRVTAWKHFRVWQEEVESFVRATFEYGEGRCYTVEVNYLRAAEKPRWYVLGDQGGIVLYGFDPQEKALASGDYSGSSTLPLGHVRLWRYHDGKLDEQLVESVPGDWGAYYRNIAAHLLRGDSLAVRPEEARHVVYLIECALQAAEERIPLNIPSSEHTDC